MTDDSGMLQALVYPFVDLNEFIKRTKLNISGGKETDLQVIGLSYYIFTSADHPTMANDCHLHNISAITPMLASLGQLAVRIHLNDV